jgi:hypothetical protein
MSDRTFILSGIGIYLSMTMLGIVLVLGWRLYSHESIEIPQAISAPVPDLGGCGNVGARPSCAPGTTTGNAR